MALSTVSCSPGASQPITAQPLDAPGYPDSLQPWDLLKHQGETQIPFSEIGWPCLMGYVDRDFQLPVWWETEGFQAFGSETGLILAVDTERKWLPTDKRALACPVTLVLTDEQGTREYYRR